MSYEEGLEKPLIGGNKQKQHKKKNKKKKKKFKNQETLIIPTSMTEHKKNMLKRLVFNKKKSSGYFNLHFKGISAKLRVQDLYHYVLDLSWWKIFLFFTICYVFIHLFFGLLYFLGGLGGMSAITTVNESYVMIFFYCFFFSVDIMTTNGTFGIIVPTSLYERCIVALESYCKYFFETLLVAFILGKFSRPSRLKRNYLFSDKAIIKKEENGYYNFAFRYGNIRSWKSPIMSVQLNLLLLEWVNDKDFVIHDLDYKVYEQTKRSMEVGYSNPILPIPHIIHHEINENSPFFKYTQDINSLKSKAFEFIIFIEGIDSATSDNYQAFKSYTQDDLEINKEFVKCIVFKENRFNIDFNLFGMMKEIEEKKEV